MVKAVEYALWLAKRDGAPIAHKDWRVYDAAKWDAVKWDFSAPGAALVKFRRVNRADGSHVNQAESVFFGGIDRKIAIPHCGYDATKPAREETDESAPLSG